MEGESPNLIDNAEDIDIVMPMYNLIKYTKNYSNISGSLWNCYRDEPNSSLGGANDNINYFIKDSKFLDYKTSITRKLENNDTTKDLELVVPLKHLANFWDNLNIQLVNCEVTLILTWS